MAVDNISQPTSLLCTCLSGEQAGKSCERIGTRESITGKVLLKSVFGSVSHRYARILLLCDGLGRAARRGSPNSGSAMMVALSVSRPYFEDRFCIIRWPSQDLCPTPPSRSVEISPGLPSRDSELTSQYPGYCVSRLHPPSTSKLVHNVALGLQISSHCIRLETESQRLLNSKLPPSPPASLRNLPNAM